MPVLIFIFGAAAVVAIFIFSLVEHRRRQRMMAETAARLGLRFRPGPDRELARRFRFLNRFRQGNNRYALNIFSGPYRGREITAGDFHYQTSSSGKRQTNHHYFSFFILELPHRFPELKIGREGVFSRIGQLLGFGDINFESHEFSRKFQVRSRDKKFAYDVCHPRMIEYLLANDDLAIEIENDVLALTFERRLTPERVGPALDRLVEVRELLPGYLFSRR